MIRPRTTTLAYVKIARPPAPHRFRPMGPHEAHDHVTRNGVPEALEEFE